MMNNFLVVLFDISPDTVHKIGGIFFALLAVCILLWFIRIQRKIRKKMKDLDEKFKLNIEKTKPKPQSEPEAETVSKAQIHEQIEIDAWHGMQKTWDLTSLNGRNVVLYGNVKYEDNRWVSSRYKGDLIDITIILPKQDNLSDYVEFKLEDHTYSLRSKKEGHFGKEVMVYTLKKDEHGAMQGMEVTKMYSDSTLSLQLSILNVRKLWGESKHEAKIKAEKLLALEITEITMQD